MVALWRVQLGKVNEKAGQSLADPVSFKASLSFKAATMCISILYRRFAEIFRGVNPFFVSVFSQLFGVLVFLFVFCQQLCILRIYCSIGIL